MIDTKIFALGGLEAKLAELFTAYVRHLGFRRFTRPAPPCHAGSYQKSQIEISGGQINNTPIEGVFLKVEKNFNDLHQD